MTHVQSGDEPHRLARAQQGVGADPGDVAHDGREGRRSGGSGHHREAGEKHGPRERHRGEVQEEGRDREAVEMDEE